MFYSGWMWVVLILFGAAQLAFLGCLQYFKYQVSRRTVCIDDTREGEPPPEWKEHWVALSNQKVVGCVTLSRQKINIETKDTFNEKSDSKDNKTNSKSQDTAPRNNDKHEEGKWWLSHLTVAPEARRRGLASRLARVAEHTGQEKGAKSIRILVGNVDSRDFWHGRGYEIKTAKWKLLGHESVFMEKQMSSEL
jgi:ribosomal protein S18 acetylase RimI-like enzyme